MTPTTPTGPICSIVLAHHEPAHLARLVRKLTGEGDSAVVHLDGRVDPAGFRAALDAPRTTSVRNPASVVWGGWSIVDATLRGLRTALVSAPDATHYQLMSGDSYPLKPMSEVRAAYQGQPGSSFIDVNPFPNSHKPAYRLRNYYVEHDPWRNPLSLPLRLANRMMRRPTGPLRGRTLLTGSQWWTLEAPAARWLIDAVDREDRLVRFMRHTRVPDESFVQILLGGSPFAATLRSPLFYADWRPGPDGRLPPQITDAHLDELQDGPFVWARKFSSRSGALLDRIDRVQPEPTNRISNP